MHQPQPTLETAFMIIQQLLKEKDEIINRLEEENKTMKIRIKELEAKRYEEKDSENLKYNYYSESMNKNSSSKPVPKLNPYSFNFNYSTESAVNQNNNNNSKESDSSGSPFKPIRNTINPNYMNIQSANNIVPVNENHYNYTPASNNNIHKDYNSVNDSTTSRNEVKNFLNEVREKIPSKDFKEFIKYIKILTDRNQVGLNRKEIFENVKSLFGTRQKELYAKFELLLSVKK